jgi:hypothetical protein
MSGLWLCTMHACCRVVCLAGGPVYVLSVLSVVHGCSLHFLHPVAALRLPNVDNMYELM